MPGILENIAAVRRIIAEAAATAGRDPQAITLIGVAKTKPVAAVEEALAAGLLDFGENYLDEARTKILALRDRAPIENRAPVWHYIGAIQSNKTRSIAELFDWVHTVSRGKIARRLSDQRSEDLPPINACIQVNIDDDPAKGGVAVADTAALVDEVQALPRIALRGLMAILSQEADPLASYCRLAELHERLRGQTDGPWDALSMGMSNDYRAAIQAGATHIRVGTAIFGPR